MQAKLKTLLFIWISIFILAGCAVQGSHNDETLFVQAQNSASAGEPVAESADSAEEIADTLQYQLFFWKTSSISPSIDLIYRQRWREAVETLKTAVHLDSLDRLFLMGYANLKLGNYAGAESLLAYLFSFDYNLGDWVNIYLAQAAYENKNYELAYQVSSTVLKIPGLIDEVADLRWRSLWKSGKKKEAFAELDTLYKMGILFKWRYKLNMAISLRDTGNTEGAKKLFVEILQNIGKNSRHRILTRETADELSSFDNLSISEKELLADSYYDAYSFANALKWYNKMGDIGSKPKAQYCRAVCMLKTGNYSGALKTLKKLLKDNSHNRPSLWWRIAQVHKKLDRFDSSMVAIDSALVNCRSTTIKVNALKERIFIAQKTKDWRLLGQAGSDIVQANVGGKNASIGLIWSIIGYLQANEPDSALESLDKNRSHFSSDDFMDELDYWEYRIHLAKGDTTEANSILKNLAERPRYNVFVWLAKEHLGDTIPIPNAYIEAPEYNPDSIYKGAKLALGESFKNKPVTIPKNSLVSRAEHLARIGLYNLAQSSFMAIESQKIFDNSVAMNLELWRYYYSLRLYSLAARKAVSICSAFKNPPPEILRLRYMMPFQGFVDECARKENIHPLFVYSTMMRESFFDPHATSYADARGLMQFIPSTGKTVAGWLNIDGFNPVLLYDYQLSIALGSRLLSELMRMRKFPAFALAEYNAGDKPVDRWEDFCPNIDDYILCVELFDFKQTRIYAKIIMGIYSTYHWLYSNQPTQPDTIIIDE